MSLTIQQLLSDAKQLSTRLKEHNDTADVLVTQSQNVYQDVEAMKEYQDDIMDLNEMAHQRPRANLVAGIQKENKHIRELQQENKELRNALEEHQNILELIMSKYRQQVVQLMNRNKADSNLSQTTDYSKLVQERTDKICEMAAVMNKAIKLDEEAIWNIEEYLSLLKTENKGLRELLHISWENGSYGHSLLTEDKEVQTDVAPVKES